MTLHIVKLCVGIESTDHLLQSMAYRLSQAKARGRPPELFHTTRMIPKKSQELIEGGSLYWVIKGNIQARQKILDIRPFQDIDGIKRCNFIVDHKLILTEWHPRGAFQGWRYLKGEDAPSDLSEDATSRDIPSKMRADLLELRLI